MDAALLPVNRHEPRLAPRDAAMLRRYLHVLGARADRLDDLVQDTFVIALEKRPEDRGEAAFGAFLRAVAKNLVLRERATAARRREVELADAVWRERCGDGDGDGHERVAALRTCVDGLPPQTRRLLDARYRDGVDREALAAELGLRPEGVKSALRRVREALKRCVERRLGGGRRP